MTDHRLEGPGEDGVPIPRDMPDQQAGADGVDALDALDDADNADNADDTAGADDGVAERTDRPGDVPDTDEAGTRRRGDTGSETVHPEHPDPDESPA